LYKNPVIGADPSSGELEWAPQPRVEGQRPGVHTSVNAARVGACAT